MSKSTIQKSYLIFVVKMIFLTGVRFFHLGWKNQTWHS